MTTEEGKQAVLDDIDEALANLGPNRPSPARVTRARTLLRGIKVACQNIAISPVTDGGTVVVPPTPGPETPPIDPAPPETPPSGGGGGGSTSPPTTTTVTTTYTSLGDFNGTQGYRGWYYLSEDGTAMTYSSGSQLWSGTETYQGIWSDGQHPGGTNGAMRRWTAQGTGTFAITGHIFDQDTTALGNNVTVTIKKNGTAIYGPQTIVSGNATGYDISVTGNCAASDTFDFLVKGVGGISFASTGLSVSIALTTTTTTGGGSSTQTTLPFTLNGTAPQEGTYMLSANKPSNADGCTIAMTGVNLASAYGRVYFNGSTNSLPIWATAPGNAGISATVTLTVPVAYMVNGSNTLRFTHDSGSGYTITAIGTPSFSTPVTPTPPATQTSLPFDLRGAILPEDAILTTSLSKPSNANGATMTVTGVNFTGTMGSYYINGQLAGALWGTVPANAGVSSTVTLSPNVTLFQNGNNAIRFTHTSGSGYTVSSVNVTFSTPSPGTDPGPLPGNNGTFQNEPAGLTPLVNFNFDTLGIGNPFTSSSLGGGSGSGIVTDSTAPLSPSNVLRCTRLSGQGYGGCQLEVALPNFQRTFVGMWWKTNSAFAGYDNTSNKLFFIISPESNSLVSWNGAPGATNAKQIRWTEQAFLGVLDNSHVAGWQGSTGNSGSIVPNVSSGSVLPGSGWHRLEAYLQCSTTRTSQNGIIRIWLDGSLIMNITNLNHGPSGSNLYSLTQAWDGSGVPNTADWIHYYDHLYISGA